MPMNGSKPTCGPFYKAALDNYAGIDPVKNRIFAAGFVSGQAEKVYLGACRAAMFRPSQDRYGDLIETAQDVADRYGLTVVAPIGKKQEVWICRTRWAGDVHMLNGLIEDTAEWHELRAWLCGVPDEEVDRVFHLRDGHGERCD